MPLPPNYSPNLKYQVGLFCLEGAVGQTLKEPTPTGTV